MTVGVVILGTLTIMSDPCLTSCRVSKLLGSLVVWFLSYNSCSPMYSVDDLELYGLGLKN